MQPSLGGITLIKDVPSVQRVLGMPFVREIDNSVAEEELTRAVRKVYERYGSDLNAFFRDVQERTSGSSGDASVPSDSRVVRDERTDR
jgi:hypothetical protein